MGWSIGWDSQWKRDRGYGVPAYCDHPKCSAKIDRGMGYRCGSPRDDDGCGLYFCGEHGGGHARGCPRCRKYKPPYRRIKPDHPEWLRWKLTDESWARWRAECPEEVAEARRQLSAQAGEE